MTFADRFFESSLPQRFLSVFGWKDFAPFFCSMLVKREKFELLAQGTEKVRLGSEDWPALFVLCTQSLFLRVLEGTWQ